MKTNNINKIVLLLGLFLILPNSVRSQVMFKAEAPKVVSLGEVFAYVIKTNGSGRITRPEFRPAFNDLATSEYQEINGLGNKIEQIYTHTTTLRALQEGKFTIGEAILVDEAGKTYKTEPISIEVIKGQVPQQQGSNNEALTDVFMRFIPSRTSLYRGDNLTLTLKVYHGTQTRLARLQEIKFPAFDGFWVTDIPDNINATGLKWQRENVDGKIYEVAVLRAWKLTPQKSGALRIDVASAAGLIERTIRQNFWVPDVDYIRKPLQAAAITINVKDMPAGSPSSFSGAVGSFSMSANLSKNKVTANDAANLIIKITGSGNLSLVTIPDFKLPLDFDKYDSKKTVSGNSVTFEVPFIPRSAGIFTIEPINFSYFDPATGAYRTLTSNPMIIEVEKDMNSAQQVTFVNPANQRNVQIFASDIRFIKNDAEKWYVKGSRFLGMKYSYPAYIIVVVVFALIYLLLYKRNKNSQNVVLMRNRKAKGIAKKRLNIAEKAMKKNNTSVFYDEILKAVWGYLGDKFSLPMAELSRNTISEQLTAKNVEQKYIDQLIGIVDECEFARYAPGVSSSQMHTIYNATIEVISKFEQKSK